VQGQVSNGLRDGAMLISTKLNFVSAAGWMRMEKKARPKLLLGSGLFRFQRSLSLR
jgi:hypothetical protein